MTVKLTLPGKLLKGMSPKTLTIIRNESGISHIDYTNNSILIQGSVPMVQKAVELIAARDMINIDFSKFDNSTFHTRTIRRLTRKAKEDRFYAAMNHECPSFGNRPWLFITPRTTTQQQNKLIKSIQRCEKCKQSIKDDCTNISILRKLEEMKWTE